MSLLWLNGEFVPPDEARVSVLDRGFLFADGIYEVVPFYEGRPFRMGAHLARMERGLCALGIQLDVGALEAVQLELIERNGLSDCPVATVYLQVTRGVAPRGHAFPQPAPEPTVVAWAAEFVRPEPEVWDRGFSAITAVDGRWSRADLKTIQLLPNVLAQESARKAGANDAILVRDGLVLEGAHANLFVVFGSEVATPPASNQILPGVTREALLELVRGLDGLELRERPLPLEEVKAAATEIFLTGTTTEVRPTVTLDGDPVGDGRVGDVTRRIMEGFRAMVARETG